MVKVDKEDRESGAGVLAKVALLLLLLQGPQGPPVFGRAELEALE